MAPFRLARPRVLAYLAFEEALIFAVLSGLAAVNIDYLAHSSHRDPLPTVVLVGCLFSAGLIMSFRSERGQNLTLLRKNVIFGIITASLGLMAFLTMWAVSNDPMRLSTILPLQGAVAVPAALALWRWFSTRFNVFHATRENLLIVGTGETARELCRWVATTRPADYAVVGFADETLDRAGTVLSMGARVQTDYAHLAGFALGRADRVVVALEEKRGKLPVRELMELRLRGIEIEESTTFLERASGKIAVEAMLPSWLIFSEGFKTSPLRSFLKRVVDLAHSIPLLIVSAPLMLLTAVLIRLDSRGPVFFRQLRLGLDGNEFEVLKFRSMIQDAEAKSGPTWARENDDRITRVGRIIRKLRIDELPQLFNVLRGEMSFVGPRPERAHFVRQLEEKIPYYGLRMTVRPGITGWAQVEYGYGATDEDALEKLKYDLFYIKNGNLLFDLWVALKTIKVVLLGRGAR